MKGQLGCVSYEELLVLTDLIDSYYADIQRRWDWAGGARTCPTIENLQRENGDHE
jgi:hypothetical protein